MFCHYCSFKNWVLKKKTYTKIQTLFSLTFESHWYIKLMTMHASTRLLLRNFCNFNVYYYCEWVNKYSSIAVHIIKEIYFSLGNLIVKFFLTIDASLHYECYIIINYFVCHHFRKVKVSTYILIAIQIIYGEFDRHVTEIDPGADF